MSLFNVPPAGYSPTSAAEREAVSLFEYLLDKALIKTDLKVEDKTPNIDGYVTLTTADGAPVGKLEVQIKKLAEEARQIPKYQCEIPFLAYCDEAQLPVLLVVVDTVTQVAFWQYMSLNILEYISISSKGRSKVVHINPANKIEKGNNSYWQQWLNICTDDKNIRQAGKLFQKLSNENEEFNSLLNRVAQSELGKEKPEFAEIHKFLDAYNRLLDKEFLSIKEAYYSGQWKQGIAYDIFKEEHLRFYKFGISYSTNDTLIKIIPPSFTIEDLSNADYFANNYENPIKRRPVSFAYEILQKDIKKLLDNQNFTLQDVELGKEQITRFIDEFYFLVRLKQNQSSYGLVSVQTGFNVYLTRWISCYYYLKNVADPVLDLDSLKAKLNEIEIKAISDQMFRIKYPIVQVTVFSSKYNFKLINYTLKTLKQKNFETVQRQVVAAGLSSNLVHKCYTDDMIKKNYLFYYQTLPKVYDEFIRTFFPELFNELHYFKDFDREIFHLTFYKKERVFKVKYWQVSFIDKAQIDHAPEVYNVNTEEAPPPPMDFWDAQTDSHVPGKNNDYYHATVGWTQTIPFDSEFPLFQSVYNLLRKRFRSYFEKKLNNEGLSRVII